MTEKRLVKQIEFKQKDYQRIYAKLEPILKEFIEEYRPILHKEFKKGLGLETQEALMGSLMVAMIAFTPHAETLAVDIAHRLLQAKLKDEIEVKKGERANYIG